MSQKLEVIMNILKQYNCLTAKEIANFAIRKYNEKLSPAQVTGTLRNRSEIGTSKNENGATVYWLIKNIMEKKLYYVYYDCWYQNNELIVQAESLEQAEQWAYQQAVELWESWNSDEYDDWEEEVDARESEIRYGAEPYNSSKDVHIVVFKDDEIFEI